jgi:hypothetical protein
MGRPFARINHMIVDIFLSNHGQYNNYFYYECNHKFQVRHLPSWTSKLNCFDYIIKTMWYPFLVVYFKFLSCCKVPYLFHVYKIKLQIMHYTSMKTQKSLSFLTTLKIIFEPYPSFSFEQNMSLCELHSWYFL